MKSLRAVVIIPVILAAIFFGSGFLYGRNVERRSAAEPVYLEQSKAAAAQMVIRLCLSEGER